MISGIGCDLSAIARWDDEEMRSRIMTRWFDPRERDYVAGRGKMAAASAAGIFAAKEALAKALGCGIGPVRLEEVAVLHTPQGAPYYELRGASLALCREMGIRRLHLSISHDGGQAMAFCVAEKDPSKEEPCPDL